jgi:hypothetical protein
MWCGHSRPTSARHRQRQLSRHDNSRPPAAHPTSILSFADVTTECATPGGQRGYEYVVGPSAFPATRLSRYADAHLIDPRDVRAEYLGLWYRMIALPVIHRLACDLLGCVANRYPYHPESASTQERKLDALVALASQPSERPASSLRTSYYRTSLIFLGPTAGGDLHTGPTGTTLQMSAPPMWHRSPASTSNFSASSPRSSPPQPSRRSSSFSPTTVMAGSARSCPPSSRRIRRPSWTARPSSLPITYRASHPTASRRTSPP